jgi:hypothetical protein
MTDFLLNELSFSLTPLLDRRPAEILGVIRQRPPEPQCEGNLRCARRI